MSNCSILFILSPYFCVKNPRLIQTPGGIHHYVFLRIFRSGAGGNRTPVNLNSFSGFSRFFTISAPVVGLSRLSLFFLAYGYWLPAISITSFAGVNCSPISPPNPAWFPIGHRLNFIVPIPQVRPVRYPQPVPSASGTCLPRQDQEKP